MNAKKLIFIIVIAVLVIGLALLVYTRVKSNLEASTKTNQPTPSIELSVIKRGSIANNLNYTGDVQAMEQANIYSRVNGNIEKIYVDIGDYVNQGKLLASIDRSAYLQALRQNDGLLKQAKATLENNRVNYDRNKELFEKGLIPRSDLDNARTTMTVSEAAVETALANYRNAQNTISYCSITAPFSGYITKRLLDRGSYVSVGGNSTSSVIFTLSSINSVKLMVNVLERDIPLLDKVEEANVRIGTYPDEVFKAQIKKISQLIDVSSRTMPVEIIIENGDHKLKPGMFANIELVLQRNDNAMIVPSQSIQNDEKGKFVFTVGADSIAVKKYIETGMEQDNGLQVLKGLEGDDKIVTSGQTLLKDKMKVKITK